MRRAMTLSTDDDAARLLDPDAWDAPERLSDDDFHLQDGPGWRRVACHVFDTENDE